jgi:N4-gp56 family major capsid protein
MAIPGISGVTTAGAVNGVGGVMRLEQALLDVYSLDILHNAQGIMRFEEFAVRKQELLAAPGENIKFTIYNDIDRVNGGKLTEHESLSANSMSATQQTITIEEWGNAIKVSEKLLRLSWDDVMGEAATLLGRDYAVARDLALRDALFSGVSNNLTSANDDATGTANFIDASETFSIEHIREAVEILQTNDAPKFFGDYYVCFLHPHQAAYLRRDPDWVNAHQYVGTRNLFNGEIGRWEDVIFIVTTHAPNGVAGTNAAGYDANLVAPNGLNERGLADGVAGYKACIFADQCLYIADSLPVELRDNGVEDFGRTHGLAWYSLFGVDVLKPEYGVSITTA